MSLERFGDVLVNVGEASLLVRQQDGWHADVEGAHVFLGEDEPTRLLELIKDDRWIKLDGLAVQIFDVNAVTAVDDLGSVVIFVGKRGYEAPFVEFEALATALLHAQLQFQANRGRDERPAEPPPRTPFLFIDELGPDGSPGRTILLNVLMVSQAKPDPFDPGRSIVYENGFKREINVAPHALFNAIARHRIFGGDVDRVLGTSPAPAEPAGDPAPSCSSDC